MNKSKLLVLNTDEMVLSNPKMFWGTHEPGEKEYIDGVNLNRLGETILFSSRVWAEDIAERHENIKTKNGVPTILNPAEVAMAISNTVAHEFGHGFGLRHNAFCFGFIMDEGGCIGNDPLIDRKELMFSADSHRYLSSRNRN